MVQPQRYAESIRNTHSPRGEKSADSLVDSSWTSPGHEYSRIERRFCALRKVRLRSNRSVMQSLCGGIHSPREEKSEDSSWTSPKMSLRRLREDYALCGRLRTGIEREDWIGVGQPDRGLSRIRNEAVLLLIRPPIHSSMLVAHTRRRVLPTLFSRPLTKNGPWFLPVHFPF